MKSFVNKQRNCLIAMLSLIAICELLLKIDNKIIQTLGIGLTPFIMYFGILLLRNDKKNINEK